MLPAEYQQLAARTLIDRPDFIISDRDMMLVWNAIGLAGEVGELAKIIGELAYNYDSIERKKLHAAALNEMGDCYWYLAALYTKMDAQIALQPTDWDPGTLDTLYFHLAAHAGMVAEMVKKGVLHQHGIDRDKMLDALNQCEASLHALVTAFGHARSQVWEKNIEKLMTRYPDGFKSADSIARVDTIEGQA